MPIFKALHVLSMFTMVAIFIGGEIYYTLAIQARDVRALAWLYRNELRFRLVYVTLGVLVAGVIFGLLTAVTGGFDVLDGWLIAAYVLLALFFINAQIFARATVKLAEKAVEADEGHRPVEEVVGEMAASNPARTLLVVNAIIFALLILDMVLKPF